MKTQNQSIKKIKKIEEKWKKRNKEKNKKIKMKIKTNKKSKKVMYRKVCKNDT